MVRTIAATCTLAALWGIPNLALATAVAPAAALTARIPAGHVVFEPIGPALGSMRPPTRQRQRIQRPDDRPLWRLFHQGRIAALAAAIARIETHRHGWRPSPALAGALADAELSAAVSQALARNDAAGLVALAQAQRGAFTSTHIDRAWALADALHSLGRARAAAGVVDALLGPGVPARLQLATLQKARAWLAPGAYFALLARSAATRSDAAVVGLFLDDFLVTASASVAAARPLIIPDSVAKRVEALHDARRAVELGWLAQQARQIEVARSWFLQASSWRPDLPDARYGLALMDYESGRLDEAEGLARVLIAPGVEPRSRDAARGLLGAIHEEQGQRAYEAGHFAQALALFAAASREAGPSPGLGAQQAWTEYRLGRFEDAASAFGKLYAGHPDLAVANGWVDSLEAARDRRQIAAISRDATLAGVIRDVESDRAFASGWWYRAYALAPSRHRELAGLGTPQAVAEASFEDRRAGGGPADLAIARIPLAAVSEGDPAGDLWSLSIERIDLQNALIPAVQGVIPRATFARDGEVSFRAAIATTPLAAGATVRPEVELTANAHDGWGEGSVSGYSRSVSESLLSWLGQTDSAGRRWGEISRSGLSLGQSGRWGAGRSIDATTVLELLTGQAVPANEHLGLDLGLTQDVPLSRLLRASVGLRLGADTYRFNLDGFAYGEGGYFSPQIDGRSQLVAEIATPPSGRWIGRARLAAGPEYAQGAPLAGSQAGAFSHVGFDYQADIRALVQIGPYCQLGVDLSDDRAVDYDDRRAALYLEGQLGPRAEVLDSDVR